MIGELGRPRMKWSYVVKKDVEELRGGTDWKALVTYQDGWMEGLMNDGIFLEAANTTPLPQLYIL